MERHGPGECWPWTAALDRYGYGRIGLGRRGEGTRGAHVVAWELEHGPVPVAQCVLHHCDNPPCCNPSHLFLGTRGDNWRDARRKGRHPWGPQVRRGTANGLAKLDESGARAIKHALARGEAPSDLATKHGVSRSLIYEIRAGRAWGWLDVLQSVAQAPIPDPEV